MRRGLLLILALTLAACGGEPFPAAAPNTSATTGASTLTTPPPLITPTAHRVPIKSVYGTSARSGIPVDPDEAHDIALQLWNQRVQARYFRDAKGLAKLETGAALAADIGYICLLGCRGPLLVSDRVVVNLPFQATWPVAFSANAFYTQGCGSSQPPCHDSFVVVQRAQNAPWKIAHYITYAGATFADEPASLSNGWAQAPRPSPILLSAPAEYAANLTSLSKTGGVPNDTHILFDWYEMNAPDTQRAERDLGALGLEQTLAYRVDPKDPAWSFAGSNSVQFTCGTVRFRQVVTGTGAKRFVQPPDLSTLGDKVPAGIYTRVTVDGLHMACFEQHLHEEVVQVLGEWGDATTITAAK